MLVHQVMFLIHLVPFFMKDTSLKGLYSFITGFQQTFLKKTRNNSIPYQSPCYLVIYIVPYQGHLTRVVPSYKKFLQVFISSYKVQIMLIMQTSFAKYIPFANAGLRHDTVVSIKLQ